MFSSRYSCNTHPSIPRLPQHTTHKQSFANMSSRSQPLGSNPSTTHPESQRTGYIWTCDRCRAESLNLPPGDERELHVKAGQFVLPKEQTTEAFICPTHVTEITWRDLPRGGHTFCSSESPGHYDHNFSLRGQSAPCSAVNEEGSMRNWVRNNIRKIQAGRSVQ